MSAPDKKNLSPFGLAALALDAEFVELERLSGQIERIAIESDSGLERAQSLLIKFAECGQRVADGVIAFSKALQDAHVRAEKAGQTVSARLPLRVTTFGSCQSERASSAVSQLPSRTPRLFAPFTRLIPEASSGLSSPESAASYASRRTDASRTLIVLAPAGEIQDEFCTE